MISSQLPTDWQMCVLLKSAYFQSAKSFEHVIHIEQNHKKFSKR